MKYLNLNKNFLRKIVIGLIIFSLGKFVGGNFQIFKSIVNGLVLKNIFNEIIKDGEVQCPLDSIVIAYFGQSNSAGFVKPKYKDKIPNNLLQYDWRNKKCFAYKEPLLGSDGSKGNSITAFASELANKTDKNILIVHFGKGGSSINLWAYGYLFDQYELLLGQLKESNLVPNLFLWHQGESDNRFFSASISNFYNAPYFSGFYGEKFQLGMRKNDYKTALKKIIKTSRKFFPESYFGVALVSRCGKNSQSEILRKAQKESVNSFKNAFISADSDAIFGYDYRYDDCHFNQKGIKKLGDMYMESTINIFNL